LHYDRHYFNNNRTFLNLLSKFSIRLQNIDKVTIVPVTDITHVGVGAFLAKLTVQNPLATVLGFLLYIVYQIVDYKINKDTLDKDLLTFAIGFFGALGYNEFF